jgi:hypothetical protein
MFQVPSRCFSILLTLVAIAAFISCDSNPVDNNKPVKIGPKLSIPESTFDFGYAPTASTVSHTFWLYSTGDDTLRITRINPG